MIALENVNETKWPKELKIISAKITLNPICPRYLEDYSFDIHFAFPNILMKRITLHEISHFIFFKKFKEIYPKINPKRFEYPNIVWNLSEIVPLMILGDKRIQEIIEHEPSIYNVYKKLKINEKNILEILQNFYNKRKNFTDFIKTSYNFMKKHEKEIKTKFEMI